MALSRDLQEVRDRGMWLTGLSIPCGEMSKDPEAGACVVSAENTKEGGEAGGK